MNNQIDFPPNIQKTNSEKTLPALEDVSRTENSIIDPEGRTGGKYERTDLKVLDLEKGDKNFPLDQLKIVRIALVVRFLVFFKVLLQVPCIVFYPVYCFALFADLVSYCGARNLVKKVLDFSMVLTGVLLAVRSYFLYYFARIVKNGHSEKMNVKVILCLFGIIHCLEIFQIAFVIFISARVSGKNKVWVERIASESRNRFKYL